jgi:threonine dehydratase
VLAAEHPGALAGRLVHPFADPAVMAGNLAIGLEILEHLPEAGTGIAPYGGGLSCGIASALCQSGWLGAIYACETENAAPLAAALRGQAGGGKIVCIVSGGNVDLAFLRR